MARRARSRARSSAQTSVVRSARLYEPVPRPGPLLAVRVSLPVSVARRARNVIYPYPYPQQKQRLRHALRLALVPRRTRYVPTKVRIRLPPTLPVVRGSYVSIDRRNRLVIHSRRQTARLLDREYNRRRYQETKTRNRRARHGQLDSVRSDPHGIIARSVATRGGIRSIADAALVSRALERMR